jgi:hypothetical protein
VSVAPETVDTSTIAVQRIIAVREEIERAWRAEMDAHGCTDQERIHFITALVTTKMLRQLLDERDAALRTVAFGSQP